MVMIAGMRRYIPKSKLLHLIFILLLVGGISGMLYSANNANLFIYILGLGSAIGSVLVFVGNDEAD